MGHSKHLSPECEMAAGCLASRLRLLNRVVTNLYAAALRPHGIRVSQMNILVVIALAGPVRAVDVSRRLHLDTSTLSRDLERLIAHGWVRATPGKGRAVQLEVTAPGRKLLAAVRDDWRAAQREARKLLSADAAEAIVGAVDALRAADTSD